MTFVITTKQVTYVTLLRFYFETEFEAIPGEKFAYSQKNWECSLFQLGLPYPAIERSPLMGLGVLFLFYILKIDPRRAPEAKIHLLLPDTIGILNSEELKDPGICP